MRARFDEQLDQLNQELTAMGLLCEKAIRAATASMDAGQHERADEVPEFLEQISSKERDIESLCLRLLMQQQPVARDLRTVSSALKMVTDLERIGVQSGDIAEIVHMNGIRGGAAQPDLSVISDTVIHMVTASVDAFVAKDEMLARSVIQCDNVADSEFDKIKSQLVAYLKKPEADGECMLDLLMIAKYLERIGDHAVNVAEWVLFSITGLHEETGQDVIYRRR